MSAPEIIPGLSAIADRYDVVLCDVWGVIHNGRTSFAAACDALVKFRERHGPVVLISNAPRPSKAVIPQLDTLGVPRDAWSAFVTSGDATRDLLSARAPGPVWAIGPKTDAPLYEGLPLRFAGPEDAAFISCSGLYNDEQETPDDYRADLAVAAERNLTMVCANPDRLVHRGTKLIWCAGGLADLYEELGGPKAIMAGKPYASIYDLALREARSLAGSDLDPRRVLCIGDGAPTDLLGANNQGLDVLFVAGGLHGEHVLEAHGGLEDRRLSHWLAGERVSATSAIPALVW
jgi:HAD superfamily hydrolase (TIGR01459 family)